MKRTNFIFALLTTCLWSLPLFSDAQTYIGLRLGYPTSISLKHFLSEKTAVEVYVGTRGYSSYRWINLSGAILRHNPIEDVNGLQYYFGAGASVLFWNFDNVALENNSTKTIGLNGYAGIEYVFENVPVEISLDYIPTVFINGYTSGFSGGYGTFGVRYILSR